MFHQEYIKVTIVQSELELQRIYELAKKSKYLYWDTETSGLRVRVKGNDYTVGWTLAFDEEVSEEVFYLPVAHYHEQEYISHIDMEKLKKSEEDFPEFTEDDWLGKSYRNLDAELVLNLIKKIFNLPIIKVAHNQSFDMHLLANDGLDVARIYRDSELIEDTMVMFHTIKEDDEKKLEKIVEHAYGIKKSDYKDCIATINSEERKALGRTKQDDLNFSFVQIPVGGQYSGEDVWFMKQLFPELKNLLIEDEQYEYYRSKRIPFLVTLWKMEREGAGFDKEKALKMQIKAKETLDELKYKLLEIVGLPEDKFNIESNQHLYELLHGFKKKLKDKKNGGYKDSYNDYIVERAYGFPVGEMTTGGKEKDNNLKTPKMDKLAMAEILGKTYRDKKRLEGQKFIRLLLRYNKLNKLYGTYMIGMVEEEYQDGRIHPSYNQCATVTHRISCSSPNLLNLPRPLENVKEPKREDFATEEAFQLVYDEYKIDKDEYDFWSQFEIRELIISQNEDEVILASDECALEKRITANRSHHVND